MRHQNDQRQGKPDGDRPRPSEGTARGATTGGEAAQSVPRSARRSIHPPSGRRSTTPAMLRAPARLVEGERVVRPTRRSSVKKFFSFLAATIAPIPALEQADPILTRVWSTPRFVNRHDAADVPFPRAGLPRGSIVYSFWYAVHGQRERPRCHQQPRRPRGTTGVASRKRPIVPSDQHPVHRGAMRQPGERRQTGRRQPAPQPTRTCGLCIKDERGDGERSRRRASAIDRSSGISSGPGIAETAVSAPRRSGCRIPGAGGAPTSRAATRAETRTPAACIPVPHRRANRARDRTR